MKISPDLQRLTGMIPVPCPNFGERIGIIPKACRNFREGTGIVPEASQETKESRGKEKRNLLKINGIMAKWIYCYIG